MSAIPTKLPPSEFDQAHSYPSQPPVAPPYSQQPPEAPGFNQAPMYPQSSYEPAPPYSAQAPTYTQSASMYPPQVHSYPQQAHSYPQQAASAGVYTQPMYPQQAPSFGFQQQQQQQQQHQQPPQVLIRAPELGDTPVRMTCLNCRHEVLSSTTTECTAGQHIAFVVMCALGFCTFFTWLCSCIPYCMPSLGGVRHECPNCHAHLGTYYRCR